jgi:hypothetical protein
LLALPLAHACDLLHITEPGLIRRFVGDPPHDFSSEERRAPPPSQPSRAPAWQQSPFRPDVAAPGRPRCPFSDDSAQCLREKTTCPGPERVRSGRHRLPRAPLATASSVPHPIPPVSTGLKRS